MYSNLLLVLLYDIIFTYRALKFTAYNIAVIFGIFVVVLCALYIRSPTFHMIRSPVVFHVMWGTVLKK